MQIMDGKEVAASIRKQIASEVEALVDAGNRPPHLAAVLVGNDGASQTYVGHKEKCCRSEETRVGKACRSRLSPNH